MDEPNDTVVLPEQSEDAKIASAVLAREARRRSTMLSVSLPGFLLVGIALFSSMKIDSIYVVGGGAVAGLVVWAALINLVPLRRDSWAYKLLLAGDRTAAEEESIARHESGVDDTAAPDDSETRS